MIFEIEIPLECKVPMSKRNMLKLCHETFGHVHLRAVITTSKLLADPMLLLKRIMNFSVSLV